MPLGLDKRLPYCVKVQWAKCKDSLPKFLKVSIAVPTFQAPFQHIDMHSFGDASKSVKSSATDVVNQSRPPRIKFKVVKEGTKYAETGVTLQKILAALAGFPVNSVVSWSDSSVALHWVKGNGKYKQYVNNRVDEISLSITALTRFLHFCITLAQLRILMILVADSAL